MKRYILNTEEIHSVSMEKVTKYHHSVTSRTQRTCKTISFNLSDCWLCREVQMSPSWMRKTNGCSHPRSKSTVDRPLWGAGEIQLSFQWLCEQARWAGIRSHRCRARAQHPPILPATGFLLSAWESSGWSGKQRDFIPSQGWDSPVHLEGEVCSNPQASKTNHELALMSPVHQA